MIKFFMIVCASMVLISSNLTADPSTKKCSLDNVDYIVNDALKTFNVPGAAIGVVIDDQVVYARGFGTRDIKNDLSVTENTLFPTASCTKAFTAFLIAQLVDEGKINFDDPVIKFIPEFSLMDKNVADQVTIRDLLAHRTGMPRHEPIWLFLEFPRTEIISLLKQLEPAYGLREEFQYNNIMYALAGLIIERVTGEKWEDAIFSRIFRPLAMKDSNVSLEHLKMNVDFAHPYAEINGENIEVPFRNLHAVNPCGGINSNILDMTKWVKLQISNENLVGPDTLNEMRTILMHFTSPVDTKEDIYLLGYGLGWMIGKYRGHAFINHGGTLDGFFSDVAFLPEQRIGIVILTNSSSDGSYLISCVRNQIIDQILGEGTTDWPKKIQEIRMAQKLSLQQELDNYNAIRQTIQPLQLDNYVGSYKHPSYGTLNVTIQDNLLLADYGTLKLPLFLKNQNVFIGKIEVLQHFGVNPIVDFKFIQDTSNCVYKLEVPFEAFRSVKPITFIRE